MAKVTSLSLVKIMATRQKLNKNHWIEAAYFAMLQGGLKAISVESIARKLGVTKGSFYWHFKNRDALVTELIDFWEQAGTHTVISKLNEIKDPNARLMALLTQAWANLEHVKAEAILQAAAARAHPLIAPAHARVSRLRLDYTTTLYLEMGLPSQEAQHWGRTAYGLYLGMIQLVATIPETIPNEDALADYLAHISQILLPKNSIEK